MENLIWPHQYMHTTDINDPIEKIWDTIDAYTFEGQSYEKERQKSWLRFVVPIPPLRYENKITKGVFFSQGADVIVEKYPRVKEIFFVIANSMFASYPWAKSADAMFVCYKNPKREEHYFNKYKDRQGTVILPLQDADFTNEYTIAPKPDTLKTIDVLMVSTVYPVKNIPVFASALIEYEKLYKKRLKATLIVGSKDIIKNEDGTVDYSALRSDAKAELEKVEKILKTPNEYLDIIPRVNYGELPKYYTSAKCCVLTSLLEGKNRFIAESMSCNTPVIVFKDFNKYTRGSHPAFFENSGEYVEHYNPTELAQTIHKVITNQKNYKPRKNYLKYYGRKNFVNTIADYIPYYKKVFPDFEDHRFTENLWLDLATYNNLQMSYHDFLYGKNPKLQTACGLEETGKIIDTYFKKLKIK